ncbi:MAG: hypothetical protein ACU0BS_11950 [Hasllibacter sp.]
MRPVLILLVLAACGADAPPRADAPAPGGVTVTGDARFGVVFTE